MDFSLHLIGSLCKASVSLVVQAVYARTQKQMKHLSLLLQGLTALLSYAQDVDDSITLGLGTPDSGVQVRHVTNGTHGFAQVRSQAIDSSDLNKRETYDFAQIVAGLKFSYSKRCSDDDYYSN